MHNKRIVKFTQPNTIKSINKITGGIKNIIRPDIKRTPAQKKVVSMGPIDPNYKVNHINHLNKTKNKRIFIIGGGPSLIGFDFSILKNEDTMAINKAIEYVEHATYFVTMDYSFLIHKLEGKDFNLIKNKSDNTYFVINLEHPYIKLINNMYVDTRTNMQYAQLDKFTGIIKSRKAYDERFGFANDLDNFNHGNNSGFCALQLAILLGYEEIYLLGFDLGMPSEQTHFHNGYKQDYKQFSRNLIQYRSIFAKSLSISQHKTKIISCSKSSFLNTFIKYVDIDTLNLNKELKNENIVVTETPNKTLSNDLRDLIIVGYYTLNTPYEQEAQGLINSCKKLNLRNDIVGIKNFGSWQSNTRFKATFMLEMLKKYPGQKLLYVDCDAVIHSRPILLKDYDVDVAVRYQDFRWRKNECLSGTIMLSSNEKTIKMCERWIEINNNEGPNAKTLEQWNLDKAIQEGKTQYGLSFKNLPPEMCFIFDSMKAIYPGTKPIIEHFQASRKYRNKV